MLEPFMTPDTLRHVPVSGTYLLYNTLFRLSVRQVTRHYDATRTESECQSAEKLNPCYTEYMVECGGAGIIELELSAPGRQDQRLKPLGCTVHTFNLQVIRLATANLRFQMIPSHELIQNGDSTNHVPEMLKTHTSSYRVSVNSLDIG